MTKVKALSLVVRVLPDSEERMLGGTFAVDVSRAVDNGIAVKGVVDARQLGRGRILIFNTLADAQEAARKVEVAFNTRFASIIEDA